MGSTKTADRVNVAVEIVIVPYGEPPFGGFVIPSSRRSSVCPDGVSSATCEPSERSCFFAYFSSTKAPSAPSRAGTAAEPAFQSMSITLLTFGSTALTCTIFPNAYAA